MEILGVIILFGVIIGIVAIRSYIGKRAAADRRTREGAKRGNDG